MGAYEHKQSRHEKLGSLHDATQRSGRQTKRREHVATGSSGKRDEEYACLMELSIHNMRSAAAATSLVVFERRGFDSPAVAGIACTTMLSFT
jgi:hypothetical protein